MTAQLFDCPVCRSPIDAGSGRLADEAAATDSARPLIQPARAGEVLSPVGAGNDDHPAAGSDDDAPGAADGPSRALTGRARSAAAGCSRCRPGFLLNTGVLDFVTSGAVTQEQDFYNSVYRERGGESFGEPGQHAVADDHPAPNQPPEAFSPLWQVPWARQNQLLLDSLGDLSGKTVAIIGNGTSEKELALLTQRPSVYIYSDLSPIAAARMKSRVTPPAGTTTYFCAIDAHQMPLQPNSVDLLYGYAMVHHLPRLPEFFDGVVRALKPGGKAVFMDDAYAPLWHASKMTIARPLMWFSHARTGISPEDLRFSMSGGFREEVLGPMIQKAGGIPYFRRVSFFNYLWHRAVIKLLPRSLQSSMTADVFDRLTARADEWLLSTRLGRRNQIRIVWGMTKPGRA